MSTLIQKPKFAGQTKVGDHEKVSALLTALVTIVGTIVLLFFLFWLLAMIGPKPTVAIPMQAVGDPGEDAPEGEAEDLEEPGVEELPEVEVPQLADALEAVTDAISSIQGRLERVDGSAKEMGRGSGLGHRDGGGGGGTGAKPWDRWNVQYTSTDIRAYAKQLTYFGIEVGVVSSSTPRVDIISNLSTSPKSRVGNRRTEKRVYFIHSSAKMRRWDEQLAQQAGVNNLSGRFLVQFYPKEISSLLIKLEAEFAAEQGIKLQEVIRTTFLVRDTGNGYEYYVDSIE